MYIHVHVHIILIYMQVLRQLELKTGRKVTEIFDWIVGTSTGAVLALGLVYGMKIFYLHFTTCQNYIYLCFVCLFDLARFFLPSFCISH